MINQMKYYNCNRYCSEEHINESNVSLSLAVLLSKLFIYHQNHYKWSCNGYYNKEIYGINGIHEYMKYMYIWNENQCVIESNNIDVSRETFESALMRRRR